MAAPNMPAPTLATFVGPPLGDTVGEGVGVGVAEAVLLQVTESGRLLEIGQSISISVIRIVGKHLISTASQQLREQKKG
jgi:hypothetical protein